MNGAITRAERSDLLKVARLRTRVALGEVDTRSAELLADFEQQLASIYSFDNNEIWAAAHVAADAATDKDEAEVVAECRRLGIPDRLAPGLGRGENTSAQRRGGLRKVATTRIAAMAERAKAEINRASAAIQTELIAVGLGSEAKAMLDKIPTAAALMAPLAVEDVEKLLLERGR